MKYIIMLLISLVAFNTYAEVDTTDLGSADEALEMSKIDLEGTLKEKAPAPVEKKIIMKKPLSASERLRLRRERLEYRNKIMVEKKMEQIRWQQEIALAKKLEDSMNQTIKAIEIK